MIDLRIVLKLLASSAKDWVAENRRFIARTLVPAAVLELLLVVTSWH